MAELLLARGAEIEARNEHLASPLLLAAQRGNLPVLEFLLERGANTRVRSVGGRTPLEAAEASDQAEAAEILRRHGSP
jgi:ankyrin repeat protein